MTKSEYINQLRSENAGISEETLNEIMSRYTDLNDNEFNEAIEQENEEYENLEIESEDEPIYERYEMASTYKELNKQLDKEQGKIR
jgi:uncharacterized membrane protein